ncbi:MAG: cryptochrome/photolyase family protein, partial [Bacteroidota bacterium]
MPKTLRLILGDQLNEKHSWFKEKDASVTFLMMEVLQETNYVKHHIQKVIAFFLSMRNFAEARQKEGYNFIYLKLDDDTNTQHFHENVKQLIASHKFEHFEYQLPDEYRLDQQLDELGESLDISVKVYDTAHFLTERDFLRHFFEGKKTYLMESFYRHMRKKLDILMENGKPIGGKWNYDTENRKKYDSVVEVPTAKDFAENVNEVVQLLVKKEVATIGNIPDKNFLWPTSRKASVELLYDFFEKFLPHFGTYEDAMETDHPFLFHSRLSFALNTKMLHPLEVVQEAVSYWEHNQDEISIAQVEGFIRQIIGWREFMRGVYWAKMPDFATMNYFNHERKLPNYYWTGNTKMQCMKTAISNSLDHAYAHHIQRLMVTGNFALLAGISPDELDEWYLGIYIDAIEWVEITNTRGMSQFA